MHDIPAWTATLEQHRGWHQYLSTTYLCLAASDWINLPCHQQHAAVVATVAWSRAKYTRTVGHSCLSLLVMSDIHPNFFFSSSPSLSFSGYMENLKCSGVVQEMLRHVFRCPESTASDSLIAVKSPWATVNWHSGISIPHFDLVQRGENSSLLDMIQWKHHGHHDLQSTTNPLNFEAISYIWAKDCCFYECEPTTAAN